MKLTAKDKKNIKKFVELWLGLHKKEAEAFLSWKSEQKPQKKLKEFRLALKVPRELSDMLTTDYPKLFEKGDGFDWFCETFDIFVMK